MTVEASTYINTLNASYPVATDPKSEGDDHIRAIKSAVKLTFPNVTGPVTATQAELNSVTDKLDAANPSYTGTLTGGTGVVNLGSGQLVKDAAGNVGVGTASPAKRFDVRHAYTSDTVVAQIGNINNGNGGTPVATLFDFTTNNGVPVGRIGSVYTQAAGQAYLSFSTFNGTLNERARIDASGNLTPGADNTQTNGSGALRWSTIYAGTGTINTSDAREKTPVRAMAADEIDAAKALSKEIGVYQFLDSVAAKGDKARHHIGMTVQRAVEIMEAHGLNPFVYGFICYDKWDEQVTAHPAIEARAAVDAKAAVLDAEGNVTEPAVAAQPAFEAKAAWTEVTQKAGDRYSFRYDQLTLFIARGIHARLEALEAK